MEKRTPTSSQKVRSQCAKNQERVEKSQVLGILCKQMLPFLKQMFKQPDSAFLWVVYALIPPVWEFGF